MANPYVPTNLRVEQYFTEHAAVAWDFPAPGLTPNYTFKIYTSLVVGGPFTGPAFTTPRSKADVQNPYGLSNFYIRVSSYDINTLEESAQTASVFISLDHAADGVGGAVARSDTGVPKHLRTDEEGRLEVSGTFNGSITGFATEAKQDAEIVILEDIRDAILAGGGGGGSVTPAVEFNEFFHGSVPTSVLTSILSFTIPGSPSTDVYVITGLYCTGQGPCLALLRKNGVTVWNGRIGDTLPNEEASFTQGGIHGDPGDLFEVLILQDYATTLVFSGNIFGTVYPSGTAPTQFNDFFSLHVPPSIPTNIYSLTVPGFPSLVNFNVTGIYVTGQGPCVVTLKRSGIRVWEGRIGDTVANERAYFVGGSIKGIPGQTFDVFVTHDHTAPLMFSGNLFGFEQ